MNCNVNINIKQTATIMWYVRYNRTNSQNRRKITDVCGDENDRFVFVNGNSLIMKYAKRIDLQLFSLGAELNN